MQKVVGPCGVTTGVVGIGFTTTTVAALAVEVQAPDTTLTVWLLVADTVILCVVAPLLQWLPLAADDVKITLPPAQKVSGPDAETVGLAGLAPFTDTVTDVLDADVQAPETDLTE